MKHLMLIILLGWSIEVYAVEWGNWGKVESVYVKTDTGSPFVKFQPGTMPGCYDGSGAYLSGNDADKAYSTILAALLSKRDVRPLYEIDPNGEGWGMCKIKSLFIQ